MTLKKKCSIRNKVFFIAFCSALVVIFYKFSQIDLLFSGLFYDAMDGFFLKNNWIVNMLSKLPFFIGGMLVIISFIMVIRAYIANRSLSYKFYIKPTYIVLLLLIGPVITAHYGFKPFFGRARPEVIQHFGGNAQFSLAFEASDQCTQDCSFISGHTAAAFSTFSLVFITKNNRRKRLVVVISLMSGFMVGIARIAIGKHFLSDVLFSGVVIYLIAYALAKIINVSGKKYVPCIKKEP